MSDMIIVTLREIADAAGIGVEGARARAKRRDRAGTWRILPSNHPADPLRIEMPREDLDVGSARVPTDPDVSPLTNDAAEPPREAPHSTALDTLQARVDELREDLARERTERQQERDRANAARERVDGLTDEITKLAAQLAAVASEMKDATTAKVTAEATLTAERDRLTREADVARAELTEWRARSWWRRLAG